MSDSSFYCMLQWNGHQPDRTDILYTCHTNLIHRTFFYLYCLVLRQNRNKITYLGAISRNIFFRMNTSLNLRKNLIYQCHSKLDVRYIIFYNIIYI